MRKLQYLDNLSWDQVQWHESYNKVRRIQRRIYKAKQLNQKDKVWWLQKLLLRNPHAKLVAVHSVTTLNKGKRTPGIDGKTITTNSEKLKLAQELNINGKTNFIRRIWIPKPGKTEKRPLGIPTIQDRAKQALAKLALEPEWEAQFEPNSYGFRPGRRPHDAIEAIFLHLRHGKQKWVFDADIRKCFDQINHDALIDKLETFPLMERQIRAWLEAGILDEYSQIPKTSIPTQGTPQGGVISPLLSNIALHGLENHLKNFVLSQPKPHLGASNGKRAKQTAIGVIRYADDFVLIHPNRKILDSCITETKTWLSQIGLNVSDEKSKIVLSSNGFQFLGFQFITLKESKTKNQTKTKIYPSRENVKRINVKVRNTIQNNKSASSYVLIAKLRPIILGWGNYYKYCECKTTFNKVDNMIYQQIRAWVFRRATRQGRMEVKRKYFPEGRTFKFEGREYQANWILQGQTLSPKNTIKTNHLPKLSWIKSTKHIKVQGSQSVYNGDSIYWTLRTRKYSTMSTRITNLLIRQQGKCLACKTKFNIQDILEVDHVIPLSKSGKDNYDNLQLLHRQCHVQKTKEDLAA